MFSETVDPNVAQLSTLNTLPELLTAIPPVLDHKPLGGPCRLDNLHENTLGITW